MERPPRLLLLAALLAAAVYLPRLCAPLVWDDLIVIVQNPKLLAPVPWRAYVSSAYFQFSGNDTWRPLGTLTTRAVARVAGASPGGNRLPWVLLHLATGLLLAALAASIGLAPETAAWAGALFLLHPAHVETLMCASFNEDVLVGAALCAMLLAHRNRRRGLAAAFYACAMLSKESGVLGLPLVMLMDLLAPAEPQRPRPGARRYAFYVVAAAAYLYLRFGPLAGPQAEHGLAAGIGWGDRIPFAAKAWLTDLRIFALPLRPQLEYFALPATSRLEAAACLAAASAALACFCLAAWRLRAPGASRSRQALFFLLWPLPFLALTSPLVPANILNLRLTAERYLYLPCLGAAAALAWALRRRPAVLTAVLLAWAGLAASRAADWSQEAKLWSSLASIYPWSAKAQEGLGEAFLRESRYPEAAAAFRAALDLRAQRRDLVLAHYVPLTRELSWESPGAHRGLALADLRLGRLDEAEAEFRRAADVAPTAEAFSLRALAYLQAARGRFAQARRTAEEGLAREPGDEMLEKIKKDAEKGRLSFRANFY